MSDLNGFDAHRAPAAPGYRLPAALAAALMVCACCAALSYSASIVSSGTTLPVVMLEESPSVLALVDTAAKLLADGDAPIILVLSASAKAYPDTADVPLRARLLTPTRFVLER